MGQVLHIFRKDLNHLWLEVVACLVAAIDFARVYPAQWRPDDGLHLALGTLVFPALSMTTLSGILSALVPITWFVVIVRVVQDEALVGNKLYWVTRPYEWPKLLGAKLLFITLFVALPFAAAETVIFIDGGFSPFAYAPHLAGMIVISLLAFAFPMISLAAISRSFLQASLLLLAICVALVGMAFLISDGPLSSHVSTPYSDEISFPILLLICAAIIFIQYAGRRVWVARGVAFSLIPIFLLVGANPLEAGFIESRYYPDVPGSIPVQLSIPTVTPNSRADQVPAVTDGEHAKTLSLSLPLNIAGVLEGSIITPDDARLRIVGADGTSWTSAWHSVYGHEYRAGTVHGAISVQVDKAFLARVRSRPVRLELSIALTQTTAGNSVNVDLPETGDMIAAGFGICYRIEDATAQSAPLRCRFPLGEPYKTLVSAWFVEQPCPLKPTTVRMIPMTSVYGSLRPDPDVSLTSVFDAELSFGDLAGNDSQTRYNGHLCPGTPITFTRYAVARRARYTIVADHILLAQ